MAALILPQNKEKKYVLVQALDPPFFPGRFGPGRDQAGPAAQAAAAFSGLPPEAGHDGAYTTGER